MSWTRTWLDRLRARQPTLWAVAIAGFGVGDLVTTLIGLRVSGVVEAGPVVRPLIEQYGAAGLVGVKVGTIAVGYGAWRVVPAPHRLGVPLGLALVGVAVTSWNTAVVSAALWL